MHDLDTRVPARLGNARLLNEPDAWLDTDETCQLEFDEAGWRFDYWLQPRRSTTLLVFMPSALRRDKRLVPAFHRWSWAAQLPAFDVLCVSDPTLRLDRRLLGGWMQGRSEDWVLPRTLAHVEALAAARGYRTVVFCGSSLGGFCALQAATLATTHAGRAPRVFAYAENPQVSMPRYQFKGHRDLLAQVCYGVPRIEEVPPQYLGRLDIISMIEARRVAPAGLVVTKASDTHHHDVQLTLLRASALVASSSSLRLETIAAVDDSTGHTPLSFEQFRVRLLAMLDTE